MNQTAHGNSLFFLALLPPLSVQAQITALKKEMSDRFQSRHAIKSPPHITLFPPFQWPAAEIERLQVLVTFAQHRHPIPITLSGFGAFAPRVIYIKPIKTPLLCTAHADLQDFLKAALDLIDPKHRQRSFTPHMTIAHRDLTKSQFKMAWESFRMRSLHIEFTATNLTLLQHNGRCWEIRQEWLFA